MKPHKAGGHKPDYMEWEKFTLMPLTITSVQTILFLIYQQDIC